MHPWVESSRENPLSWLIPKTKKHLPPVLLSLNPHLDPGVAFPSRCNSCSGLLRSVSPRKAGAHCAQHRGGHCNCGTAPWHLCSTAPQGCRKDKNQVCVCMLWVGAGHRVPNYPSPLAQVTERLVLWFYRLHFCLMGH